MRDFGVLLGDLSAHVDRSHSDIVEEFDARNLDSLVEELNHGLDRIVYSRERGRGYFDGDLRGQSHRTLGDDAEGARKMS